MCRKCRWKSSHSSISAYEQWNGSQYDVTVTCIQWIPGYVIHMSVHWFSLTKCPVHVAPNAISLTRTFYTVFQLIRNQGHQITLFIYVNENSLCRMSSSWKQNENNTKCLKMPLLDQNATVYLVKWLHSDKGETRTHSNKHILFVIGWLDWDSMSALKIAER